jgi:hypothetical protein
MWQCAPDTSPTVECVGSYVTTTTAGDEVPAWQGLFVQASSAGAIEVPLSARGTSQARQAATPMVAFELEATDTASGLQRLDKAAVLVLHETAADGWDSHDAEKLVPLTYPYVALGFEGERGEESILLAQDARSLEAPNAFTIPLVVEAVGLAGTATLTWPRMTLPEGWQAQLTDRMTGTTVDLAEATDYVFEVGEPGMAASSTARLALQRVAEVGVSLRSESTARFELHVMPPAATDTEEDGLPETMRLTSTYPNPASGSVSVTYTLPSTTQVRLRVYDVLGREVATLADGEQAAGAHQAAWDARRVATGVYVMRLETEQGVRTQKVTVAR